MLNLYPRPQLERANWTNLNGEWNFAFDDNQKGEAEHWYVTFPQGITILVPYAYETKRSTIGDQNTHDIVWYNRKINVSRKDKTRTLLNFEGVDYRTKVWVNGEIVGAHTGGYAAFSFDITDKLLNGENDITIKVEDSMSCIQPRGKQRWRKESFECWYVQTTGIWKSVWMEEVPEFHLNKLKITPDLDNREIQFYVKTSGGSVSTQKLLQCNIFLEGKLIQVASVLIRDGYASFSVKLANEDRPWEVAIWSPNSPKLYDVTLTLIEDGISEDVVQTYFGVRKISIEGNKVLLNNLPIYQRLILDQGYWEDTHLTPPSEEAIIKDIDLILAAGYNGVRKHQKTEDRRFLYWCDKKGLLVWSEMAAQYSFNDDAIQAFTKEWMEIVEQNYNHPSIITWTPFNESWGIEKVSTDIQQQRFTEAIYYLTKSFDPYRPVIVNDGWEHTISDIITLHDYAERGDEISSRYESSDNVLNNRIPFNVIRYAMANGYKYKGQPVILSEYGGVAFTSKEGWGYGKQVKSESDFLERFDSLTTAIKNLSYVCGFCYTQITDVQQEVNGLYTKDREPKVDIEAVRRINLK